jgi:hypothetical protein
MSSYILPDGYRINIVGEFPRIPVSSHVSPDDSRPPFTESPLDEYRGAGSATVRRIRSIAETHGDSTAPIGAQYAEARASTILQEAHEALRRILGNNHPKTIALRHLIAS